MQPLLHDAALPLPFLGTPSKNYCPSLSYVSGYDDSISNAEIFRLLEVNLVSIQRIVILEFTDTLCVKSEVRK